MYPAGAAAVMTDRVRSIILAFPSVIMTPDNTADDKDRTLQAPWESTNPRGQVSFVAFPSSPHLRTRSRSPANLSRPGRCWLTLLIHLPHTRTPQGKVSFVAFHILEAFGGCCFLCCITLVLLLTHRAREPWGCPGSGRESCNVSFIPRAHISFRTYLFHFSATYLYG